MMEFNKGSELDKQIYKEGDSTWGCKSGVLDVNDVNDCIKQIKRIIMDGNYYGDYSFTKLFKEIDDILGKKFIHLEASE